MNEFVLARAEVRLLVWHTALYGLAAILESAGADGVRARWTHGMEPRCIVSGPEVDSTAVGEIVHQHAASHASPASWVSRDIVVGGKPRGLMSPRISRLEGMWQEFQGSRQVELDQLVRAGAWLDLRMIASLGEPAYWSVDQQGTTRQDDGASRLEMQPRNQGSEFVGNRLRKLASIVAGRTPEAVARGLVGTTVVDELGNNSASSSTPTGLAPAGPVDNAVAWCALWGFSMLPTTARAGTSRSRGQTTTAGHLGGRSAEWFYAPVWESDWTVARLCTILASGQLAEAASRELGVRNPADPARLAASTSWVASRGVVGIMQFPIKEFGSKSAPERRALRATHLPIGP